MTSAMAAQGTWLCPTPLHRARLLDLEAKLARPRAIMYGSLAIAFLLAIPWVGWLPFIPLAGAVLGYSALRPWIRSAARPEYVVAATVVNAQVLIAAGIAVTGAAQSPAIVVILLPLVTLPARFSTRGVHAGPRPHRGPAAGARRQAPIPPASRPTRASRSSGWPRPWA